MKQLAVLGVAFKPDTDDVRDSPALNVAAALHLRGALVSVYDPEANATAKRSFPTLTYAASLEAAVTGADLVLVLTEWPEIAGADPVALGRLVAHKAVVDARRCLPADEWRDAGWRCVTLGSAEVEQPVVGRRARVAA